MNDNGRIYLVVSRQILVSQDIATTISDFDPGARVILAADMADAANRAVGPVAMAFVDAALWSEHHRPEALAATKIVLVGDEAAAPQPAPFSRLDLPFTTDHILALLHPDPIAQRS